MLFRPNLTVTLSHGAEREMRMLAVALDFLLDGDVARCGDVLYGTVFTKMLVRPMEMGIILN